MVQEEGSLVDSLREDDEVESRRRSKGPDLPGQNAREEKTAQWEIYKSATAHPQDSTRYWSAQAHEDTTLAWGHTNWKDWR